MAGIFGLFDFTKEPTIPYTQEKQPTGLALFFHILAQNFWKLICLNIVFIMYCIPVATIPAAYCAMIRVLRDMIDQKPIFLWIDFWLAFKRNFAQSFLFGVIVSLLAIAGYFGVSHYLSARWDAYFILIGGLACVVVLILNLMCLYIPIMIVSVKQSLITIMNNAFRLALISLFRNLSILIVNTLLTLAIVLLIPYSALFLVLLYFSVTEFIICFFVWPIVKKHVIIENPVK